MPAVQKAKTKTKTKAKPTTTTKTKTKAKPKAKVVTKTKVKAPVAKTPASKPTPRVRGSYDLVVVESPSKAKTIKKYLGPGYQVVASNGHIKDLPKSKLGVDIKKNFAMDLVPITGKQDKIDRICEMALQAKEIYLAPDMDREGEAIAHHIAEAIGRKNIHRVVFNAVTKTAIKAAISHPTHLNHHMYDSQKTRRILDRLVGYKISPLLWDKVQRGISAGRVQSVALRIIVERDDEIKAFKPEQWFSIEGSIEKKGILFNVHYYGETPDKKFELKALEDAKKILKDCQGRPFNVADIKRKERRQNPTPPFTTSKLQQDAANKLSFTAKKTMMIAQRLYEGVELSAHGLQGLITYMRTDSVRTEPESLTAVREYIAKKYGNNFLSESPIVYKKKGTSKVQDAHEAIRPTNLDYTPESVRGDLDQDQYALYELIWNKFISSQMSQAVIDQTTVIFDCSKHFFKANGSIVKFAGFRTVYFEAAAERAQRNAEDKVSEDEESSTPDHSHELPELQLAEKLPLKHPLKDEEHWTSPPPRFSEASLVKALEEQGIGRPSTYAAIISNIQDRKYVEKIENRFTPTELGIVVCRMLIQAFPVIMDVAFTAKVEDLLDKIEDGEIKWIQVLKDFWKDFEPTLEKAKEEMKNLKRQQIPTGIKCFKCATGEYQIRWGRNGQFLACSNYPECNSSQDFKKDLQGKIHILDKQYFRENCPKCGAKTEVKTGRYGRFVRCSEYPTCDTTLPYTLDVTCPECKKGKFAEKKSRFGKVFYGCSSYPDCNKALWSLPHAFECPACGYPIMCEKWSKKRGPELECPQCRHKIPNHFLPATTSGASLQGEVASGTT
ncbi:MAG: DNA topoisomerase I [Bdellovibrionales bacterium GWA2_49_15]|nr:MAG: DNA topoisomerase I [Bdellovibrionales bacterium GWA2_49_15]HAZ11803.1 type I DNA topoisomerase [Bdellovibrionales bacterium]